MTDETAPAGPGALSFAREPLWYIASIQGIIQGVILLLISFNVPITSGQQVAITGLALALGTAWARSKVYSPVNSIGQPVIAIPDRRGPDRLADNFAGSLQRVVPEKRSEVELIAAMHDRERDARERSGLAATAKAKE